MANDLNWQQLEQAIGNTGAITHVPQTGDIVISVKKVTGDLYTALGDPGVVEFVSKLLSFCRAAQTQANTTAVAGSRLNAFQAPQFGVPYLENGQYFAQITHTMQAQAPVSLDDMTGTQN